MAMHHAVELILARMETHPQDFMQGKSAPWLQIINGYKKFFTEEEGLAVRDGLRKINMDGMTEDIMKRMVQDEETDRSDRYTSALADSMKKSKTLIASQVMQQTLQPALDKMFQEAYENYDVDINEGWEAVTEEEIDETFPLKNYSVGFKVIKEDIE
jgi:hypothetical protein